MKSAAPATLTGDATRYSIREVARLFELPESRLRYWAQTGFLRPTLRVDGRAFYSFRDLIGIKVARELLDAGLSLQRVRRSLDALRLKLPDVDEPLASLRIRSEHERVIVEDSAAAFEATTGQCLLDFSVESLREQVAQVLALPRREPGADPESLDVDERTAYEWFRHGCERELGWDGKDPDHPALAEAKAAYERALDLDPGLAAAYTNLGALLAATGDIDGARDMFDEALRCDEEQPEAQSNLAALALKAGDHETAIAGYRLVLRTAPDYAEAHYGIARALLGVGGKGQALAHLERFCDAVERMPDDERDVSVDERRAHALAVIQALREELGVG
ncbi:MAG: MerR family transcriptional regulator [Nannocystaceae bacterium]|nr:MerR family transcriptional regulator [Myxococcales bacterium]